MSAPDMSMHAFPLPDRHSPQYGMTLRDYFAAAALTGLVADGQVRVGLMAPMAYRLADDMLAERAK